MAGDIRKYTGGPAACNGYLVKGESGYVAVDAPLGFADWACARLPEGERLTELILTHQHFDHVQDAARLKALTGCRICAHSAYSPELTLENEAARAWGIEPPAPYRVDCILSATTRLANWGGLEWELYAIPGHSPDGMAYGLAGMQILFTGDILFAGAIGRTDFPGGSMAGIIRGIRENLLILPPATTVYSGHGPATSIGEELLNNPYLS